jgi:hypothetical protein
MSLVDGNPQHAEALPALLKVLQGRFQPDFKLHQVRFRTGVFAVLSMRQRVQALDGMKDNRRANAFAQPVAQHQGPHRHRHIMAQLMSQMNQDTAPFG